MEINMNVFKTLHHVHKKKNERHLNEIYHPIHNKSPGFIEPYKSLHDAGNALRAVVLKPYQNALLLSENHTKETESPMDTIVRGIYLVASIIIDPIFEIIAVVTRLLSSLLLALASLLTCNTINPDSDHSNEGEMIARL
jgi:hypothetical protein